MKLFLDGFSGHSLPQCGGTVTFPQILQAPSPIAEFGTAVRPVASTRGVPLDCPGVSLGEEGSGASGAAGLTPSSGSEGEDDGERTSS